MKIILGADHGGFEIKEKMKSWLIQEKYEVVDVGNMIFDANDDYVDFAKEAVQMKQEGDMVILFCRNGMGMEIVANKRKGVRCGLGFGPNAVSKGRQDDDINCLAIPADYSTHDGIKEMIKVFLVTEFNNSKRYNDRLDKLSKIEDIWLQ